MAEYRFVIAEHLDRARLEALLDQWGDINLPEDEHALAGSVLDALEGRWSALALSMGIAAHTGRVILVAGDAWADEHNAAPAHLMTYLSEGVTPAGQAKIDAGDEELARMAETRALAVRLANQWAGGDVQDAVLSAVHSFQTIDGAVELVLCQLSIWRSLRIGEFGHQFVGVDHAPDGL